MENTILAFLENSFIDSFTDYLKESWTPPAVSALDFENPLLHIYSVFVTQMHI